MQLPPWGGATLASLSSLPKFSILIKLLLFAVLVRCLRRQSSDEEGHGRVLEAVLPGPCRLRRVGDCLAFYSVNCHLDWFRRLVFTPRGGMHSWSPVLRKTAATIMNTKRADSNDFILINLYIVCLFIIHLFFFFCGGDEARNLIQLVSGLK